VIILVTGAGGMLGKDVCLATAKNGHSVIATGRKEGLVPLDVTDTRQTQEIIAHHRPDFVLHCAAWTDVDGAERDHDGAYRANALGAWNVASAASHIRAGMIYVSTDFVFNGAKNQPYTEFDEVHPLNVYGSSKEAGERLVRQILPDRHMIVRTSWLFGKQGNCFPKTILRLAESRPEIPVVADQIGSPTYTPDLAAKLIELAENPLSGTYHVTNSGQCSWKDFAEEIVQTAGLATKIAPITAAEYRERFSSPTRRPAYSVLRHLSLEMRNMDNLRSYSEALSEYLRAD